MLGFSGRGPWRSAGGASAPRQRGFTLIELLIVISIMALLGLIIVGGSRMLLQTARERRSAITRAALDVAIHRYRTEYQRWPVSLSDKNWDSSSTIDGCKWYEWKNNNSRVFDALRAGNTEGNPDGLRFIDETAIYTTDTGDAGGKLITLSKAVVEPGKNLFYAMKRDNKPAPFTVKICFDTDECEVGPGSFNAGEDANEGENYGY